ncbi:hypothetical protein [Pectobacterium punjabense]|uniref:hypothetical protein n=1 Tax=Pectobacterium punjabense TaxID=2108399 RepID=UPI001969854D|nr:hypothetical protein [Pectobacterium punjabense]MBN3138129.1 hypothetical protein [Pectobacterium punjabense]MCE5380077.1 hypothetical protein [Pectobacterium punjabense]
MRSVKLRVDGSFWDSQIYSNQFTLFDFDGVVHHLQWDATIDSIAQKNIGIQTALRVSFSDSDLFYNQKVRKILRDPEISPIIKLQLEALSNIEISASLSSWKSFLVSNESPFDFLPTDTEVYYNQVFAGHDEGLFSTPNNLYAKKAKKHFDGSVLKINASDRNTALAVAAGSDGLYEFAYKDDNTTVLGNERQLNATPCSACEWAFQSVLGWSTEGAFLASFNEEKSRDSNKKIRRFDRIIDGVDMFNFEQYYASGYIWGSREKIYRVRDGGVDVAHYSPKITKTGKYKEQFSFDGVINIPTLSPSSIIATGTAPFGTVIETDDKIIVLRSDGVEEIFPGEVVHWRIFPRSEHYNNQLHIIYDDHLLIISFVHDYFVDQDKKLSGFSKNVKGSESLL